METRQPISKAVARELNFFGKVTASATHQIKNDLAVINETACLAVEIMVMAQQGREPVPDRIKSLTERVVARVENSNLVVKRLNAFAHSVEAEAARVDACLALGLMVHFYQRLAGLKGVTLIVEAPRENEPMEVWGRPFVVEQVIWAALESTVKAAQPDSRIILSMDRPNEKLTLKLSGLFSEKPELPPMGLLDQSSVQAETGAEALCMEFKT